MILDIRNLTRTHGDGEQAVHALRGVDLGVAAGKGMGLIFRKGKIVASLPEERLLEGLMKEVEAVVREKQAAKAAQ